MFNYFFMIFMKLLLFLLKFCTLFRKCDIINFYNIKNQMKHNYRDKYKGFKFASPSSDRMHKRFFGVCTFEAGYWYIAAIDKWVHDQSEEFEKFRHLGYSTHANSVNSFRAFKRRIRKNWSNMEGKLVLASRWYNSKKGYEYYIESIKII